MLFMGSQSCTVEPPIVLKVASVIVETVAFRDQAKTLFSQLFFYISPMPNSPFFAYTFLWCCENRVGNLDFLSDPATLNQAHVVNNPCFVVALRCFFCLISFFLRVWP